MMADITGALDLSEITRLITSASASAKPNDLKDMILKISQNKKVRFCLLGYDSGGENWIEK